MGQSVSQNKAFLPEPIAVCSIDKILSQLVCHRKQFCLPFWGRPPDGRSTSCRRIPSHDAISPHGSAEIERNRSPAARHIGCTMLLCSRTRTAALPNISWSASSKSTALIGFAATRRIGIGSFPTPVRQLFFKPSIGWKPTCGTMVSGCGFAYCWFPAAMGRSEFCRWSSRARRHGSASFAC